MILFAGAEIKQYDFCKKYIENADVILCCDSGIRHTRALGIIPDYILGDFDSSWQGFSTGSRSVSFWMSPPPP